MIAENNSQETVYQVGNTEVPDRYGREPIVSSLYHIVIEGKHEVPLIVGLEGSWGSGKTWVLDRLKEECDHNPTDVEIIDLEPVLWGSPSSLLPTWIELVSERLFKAHERLFQGYQVIEAAYMISKMVSFKIGGAGIDFKEFGEERYTNPSKLRGFVHDWLSNALKDKKVVLVLDNLDRAPRDALAAALRLILFLFLNEPKMKNLKLILVYDRKIIEELLAQEMGTGFIEKFIHITLPLPAPSHPEKLSEFLRRLRLIPEFEKQWKELDGDFLPLFEHQIDAASKALRHPRDIENVMNILKAISKNVHQELFLPDFAPLLAIQTSCPELYRALEKDPSPLIDPETRRTAFRRERSERREIGEEERKNFREWFSKSKYAVPGGRSELTDVVMTIAESRCNFTSGVMHKLIDLSFDDIVSIRRYFRMGPSLWEWSSAELAKVSKELPDNDKILASTFWNEYPYKRWHEFLEQVTDIRKMKLKLEINSYPEAVLNLLKRISEALESNRAEQSESLRIFAARLYNMLVPEKGLRLLQSGVSFGCNTLHFFQKYLDIPMWRSLKVLRKDPRPTSEECQFAIGELRALIESGSPTNLSESDIIYLFKTVSEQDDVAEILLLLDRGSCLDDINSHLLARISEIGNLNKERQQVLLEMDGKSPAITELISVLAWRNNSQKTGGSASPQFAPSAEQNDSENPTAQHNME